MKILLLSNVPLNKDNSMGNTLISLLGDMEQVELAGIYTRNGIPDAEISNAFCITEGMLVRNLLKRTPAGRRVSSAEDAYAGRGENAIVRFAKASRWTIFFWMQDILWKLGRWKSPELKQFVAEYAPDVILTVLLNAGCFNDLILHILSLTNAKFVLYAWDNNYFLKLPGYSPLRWIKRMIDRVSMKKVVQRADLFYVISDIQKKEYETCFQKPCKVLTKGADFAEPPEQKAEYGNPMQLVFTGNIAMNRWKSLKIIADVLESINQDGIRAQLRIYTATPLTGRMKKALVRPDTSFLMGRVSADAVSRIQKDADMLVHVEGMDSANRIRVRHSFSTKIVDYMKTARPILAVGPNDVASMEHLIRNDCAIFADRKTELEEKLRKVLEDPSELDRLAGNAYACGRKYHNKQDIREMLLGDMMAVCGK